MAFRLPALPRAVAIVDKAGLPARVLQQWWQAFRTAIERQETTQDGILDEISEILGLTATIEAAVATIDQAVADAQVAIAEAQTIASDAAAAAAAADAAAAQAIADAQTLALGAAAMGLTVEDLQARIEALENP